MKWVIAGLAVTVKFAAIMALLLYAVRGLPAAH
jgi:hypothetical protein